MLLVAVTQREGSVGGEVIGLCSGCLALLTGLGCGHEGRFLRFGPSCDGVSRWGVLCGSWSDADDVLEGVLDGDITDPAEILDEGEFDDPESGSKRFAADWAEESERNRRLEAKAIQRNRREDRRAKMRDRE